MWVRCIKFDENLYIYGCVIFYFILFYFIFLGLRFKIL